MVVNPVVAMFSWHGLWLPVSPLLGTSCSMTQSLLGHLRQPVTKTSSPTLSIFTTILVSVEPVTLILFSQPILKFTVWEHFFNCWLTSIFSNTSLLNILQYFCLLKLWTQNYFLPFLWFLQTTTPPLPPDPHLSVHSTSTISHHPSCCSTPSILKKKHATVNFHILS